MKRRLFFTTLAFSGLLGSSLWAAPIGTFNPTGTVTVTTDAISWTLFVPGPPPVTLEEKMLIQDASGIYSGLEGTINTIHDLLRADAPVDPNPTPPNETFTPLPFIEFDGTTLLAMLNINQVFEGVESFAQCLVLPAVPGQHCTPSGPAFGGPSPFSFTNKPAGGSTGTFTFAGVTADGGVWTGEFTSQFNVPFQTVLAAFGPNGSGTVTNSYSATVTVYGPPVPEPASMSLIGIGLILLPLAVKRFRKGRA